MKQSVFAFLLLATLSVPFAAYASSAVLLPKEGTTNPYVAAAPAPPTNTKDANTKDVDAPKNTGPVVTPILPNTAPVTASSVAPYGGQSMALSRSAPLVSPAQVKLLMDLEKQQINSGPQNAALMKQLLMASGQTQGKSEQEVNRMVADQMNAQAQKSQQRLAILQKGPVTLSDLSRLYGGN